MSPKARTLARRLLRENRGTRSKEGRSWRVIAREDYQDKINYATLNRFALSQGEWLPANEELRTHMLIVLGLKHERKVKHQCKDLFDMATDTLRQALINRQPMPQIDPRIVREFKKLGWIKRQRVAGMR
jgi:hypothetical protein